MDQQHIEDDLGGEPMWSQIERQRLAGVVLGQSQMRERGPACAIPSRMVAVVSRLQQWESVWNVTETAWGGVGDSGGSVREVRDIRIISQWTEGSRG